MQSDAEGGDGQVLGKQSIAAGLEPATVGSEVQRSSIEPRDRRDTSTRVSMPPSDFEVRSGGGKK